MLTQSYVRFLFDYNAASGVLTWRVRPSNRVEIGDRAGSNSAGFRLVRIDTEAYNEANVIWLWMTGVWPASLVDHENLDPYDNRWANLREATYSQNSFNHPPHKPGKLKWVTKYKGRYKARVRANGVTHHIGYFDTEQQAHDAARTLASTLHGKFYRPT